MGPPDPGVFLEGLQDHGREHDVPVLPPFALPDVDLPPSGVDIAHLPKGGFTHPEAASVQGEDGAEGLVGVGVGVTAGEDKTGGARGVPGAAVVLGSPIRPNPVGRSPRAGG